MTQTLTCPHCHKPFTCNPHGACWCKRYPTVKIPEDRKSDQCLCPCQLDELVEQQHGKTPQNKKATPKG